MFRRITERIKSGLRGEPPASAEERPRTLVLVVGGALPDEPEGLPRVGGLVEAGAVAPVSTSGDPLAPIVAGAPDGRPRLWQALEDAGVPFAAVGVPGRLQAANGTFIDVPSPEAEWETLQEALGTHAKVVVAHLPHQEARDVEERLPAVLEDVERESPSLLALVFAGDNGGFVLAGPGVDSVPYPLVNVEFQDLLPTLLAALRVEAPEGVEGYPLDEALEASDQWTEEDEESVKEHLSRLGYLE